MGLGLAALGRPGYVNLGHSSDLGRDTSPSAMRRRSHEVLDAAWNSGIRYFDVARSYGRAEAFLGAWLRRRRLSREDLSVGSKWGYTYTAGWQVSAERHEVKDHSIAALRRQLPETLELIGPWLGLYQIHSVTRDSPALSDREVLSDLAELRDGGIAVGLSLSGPDQADVLARAAELRVRGDRLFSCVQATWNLLEPSAGPAMEDAHGLGLGVIAKEVLANGRLAGGERGGATKLSSLEELGAASGVGADTVAIGAALAQPWIDVVLSGAATVDQLRSNLRAQSLGLTARASSSLASQLAEEPSTYWDRRRALPWN